MVNAVDLLPRRRRGPRQLKLSMQQHLSCQNRSIVHPIEGLPIRAARPKGLLRFTKSAVQLFRDLNYPRVMQDRKMIAIDLANRDAAKRYRTPAKRLVMVRIIVVPFRAEQEKMPIVRRWNVLSCCCEVGGLNSI